ncbi:hypothetical protein U1Q18_031934 [Sarracenia purpurea var. burkii]
MTPNDVGVGLKSPLRISPAPLSPAVGKSRRAAQHPSLSLPPRGAWDLVNINGSGFWLGPFPSPGRDLVVSPPVGVSCPLLCFRPPLVRMQIFGSEFLPTSCPFLR